jgi:hypothetical protein
MHANSWVSLGHGGIRATAACPAQASPPAGGAGADAFGSQIGDGSASSSRQPSPASPQPQPQQQQQPLLMASPVLRPSAQQPFQAETPSLGTGARCCCLDAHRDTCMDS